MHSDLKARLPSVWKEEYKTISFKFEVDCYASTRTSESQRELINSFAYIGLKGPVRMKNPEVTFVIHEEYGQTGPDRAPPPLKRIFLGRLITSGNRQIIDRYDVKKRHYIGNTTMDAELSLITANFAQAAPGKLVYDPFAGTGSFLITAAHFGATVWGSDIDGRSLRGKKDRSVRSNFERYKLKSNFGDAFVADLTNTPIRPNQRMFDAIMCDPPYGVREGLKVLGSRDPTRSTKEVIMNGTPRHTQSDYIPPKRPYSFTRMLDDILAFASEHLVENGRLCMWMPTANDETGEAELPPPMHPNLELKAVCVQSFNKWSRQLLTYQLREVLEGKSDAEIETEMKRRERVTADELNEFRRKVVPDIVAQHWHIY